MARRFSNTPNTNRMTLGVHTIGPLLSGASKISLHCMARANSLEASTEFNNLMFLSLMSSNSSSLRMGVRGDVSPKVLSFGGRSVTGDSFQRKYATTTFGTGTWYGCGGTNDIGNDTVTPYFQGVAEGGGSVTFGNTTYTDSADAEPDSIGYGSGGTGVYQDGFDGDIAEMGIWTFGSGESALTDAEFAALAKGFSPLLIRPQNLVFYMPIMGAASPERDRRSGLSGTITGTIAASAHPRVWYPRRSRIDGVDKVSLQYSQDFTVSANTDLDVFNPLWVYLTNGGASTLEIDGTNDRVRKKATADSSSNVWTGMLNTEQRIVSDIHSGDTTCFAALWCRKQPTTPISDSFSFPGYLCQWDSGGKILLYRVTAGPTFTVINGGGVGVGTVATNTTYTNCFLKATGTGSTVTLDYGDDTNGTFQFLDTDGARITTAGYTGFDVYDSGLTQTCWFDNVDIYDESIIYTVTPVAGTLVLSGIAPVVTQGGGSNTTITPTVGTLVLTGVAPLVTRQNTIQPTTGSLLFTGQQASVTRQNTITPTAGTLTLTGIAPTLLRSGTVQPNSGALVLQGVAPVVSQNNPNPTITPVTGSLLVLGYLTVVSSSSSGASGKDRAIFYIDSSGRNPHFRI